MPELERRCIDCGALIEESMGTVLTRDFIRRLIGDLIAGEAMRERCGICGVRHEDFEPGGKYNLPNGHAFD